MTHIERKAAGPAGTAHQGEQVRVTRSAVTVRWPKFMLSVPKPAPKDPAHP